MHRLIVFAVLGIAAVAWAQDPAPADNESATETEAPADDELLTDEELEELDIDGQEDHTEEDEGVFKPTDVVSFQQSVEFPVDI